MNSMKGAYLLIVLCIIKLNATKLTRKQTSISVHLEDSDQLWHLVKDRGVGCYVDVGAYDPVYSSKTLWLHTHGWHGVHVEPHSARYIKFMTMRPQQISLNLAIGQSQTIVDVFKNNQLEQTSAQFNNSTKTNDKMLVRSISLSDLCKGYFTKTPTVINICAKQSLYKILNSNDWTAQKCHPQVFTLSLSSNPIKEEQNYDKILKSNKYTKLTLSWKNVQIYVKEHLAEVYRKNYDSSVLESAAKVPIQLRQAFIAVAAVTRKQILKVPFTDTVKLYFAKEDEQINFQDIRIFDNNPLQYYPNSGYGYVLGVVQPPIVIFNYDIEKNSLILKNCSFQITKFEAEKMDIFQLTILSDSNSKEEFFIIPKQTGKRTPQLIVSDKYCVRAPGANKFISLGKQSESLQILFAGILLIILTLAILYRFKKGKKQHIQIIDDEMKGGFSGQQSSTSNE